MHEGGVAKISRLQDQLATFHAWKKLSFVLMRRRKREREERMAVDFFTSRLKGEKAERRRKRLAISGGFFTADTVRPTVIVLKLTHQ